MIGGKLLYEELITLSQFKNFIKVSFGKSAYAICAKSEASHISTQESPCTIVVNMYLSQIFELQINERLFCF